MTTRVVFDVSPWNVIPLHDAAARHAALHAATVSFFAGSTSSPAARKPSCAALKELAALSLRMKVNHGVPIALQLVRFAVDVKWQAHRDMLSDISTSRLAL